MKKKKAHLWTVHIESINNNLIIGRGWCDAKWPDDPWSDTHEAPSLDWCHFLLKLLFKNPSDPTNVCTLKTDVQFFITAFTNGMSMSDAPLCLPSMNVWPVLIRHLTETSLDSSSHTFPFLDTVASCVNAHVHISYRSSLNTCMSDLN